LIGKSDFYFYPTNLAEKYRADDQAVIQAGVPWEAIEENQPEGGVKSYVYVSKTPLRNQDGNIFALRILYYPIPGRPDTTLPVFTNEWVAAHAIVIDKDTNSVFVNANEAFLKTLRPTFPGIVTVTNLIGRDDNYFYPAYLAEKFRADDQRVLAAGTNWVTVEENQPLGAPKFYLQVTKYPMRNDARQIIGLRIVAFTLPSLSVQPAKTSIELSWPLDYTPFVLQHSEDVGLPWNDLNGESFVTNGMIHTTVTNATRQEFYRLRMDAGSW
jgi:two-component system sensor histidine kinase/response regulator